MGAQCAVCLGPLNPKDMIVEGPQAFHRQCLPAQDRSILVRFRLALQNAKAALVRVERDRAQDRHDAANTRVQNMTLESDLQIARTRLRTAEAALKAEHDMLEAERARNRRDREEAATSMRRHAELLAENDRLRNELQVFRALGGSPAPARVESEQAQDGKDPATIRAELLELD